MTQSIVVDRDRPWWLGVPLAPAVGSGTGSPPSVPLLGGASGEANR